MGKKKKRGGRKQSSYLRFLDIVHYLQFCMNVYMTSWKIVTADVRDNFL